jgi:hypothetical protein
MALRRLIRAIALAFAVASLLVFEAIAAQEDPNVAAVLVDTGVGEPILIAVAFEEESIPAIELLQRSGLPVLSVPFGGLGEGVCMIDTTGCDLSACRRALCQTGANAPFWHFLVRERDHDWSTSPLGVSSVSIGDGDVTAWLWASDAPDALPDSFGSITGRTGNPSLGQPARFPVPGAGSDSRAMRSWIVGSSMIALTGATGVALLLRSRRAAR